MMVRDPQCTGAYLRNDRHSILALPSIACFPVPLAAVRLLEDPKSLSYQLEGDVPIDAENMLLCGQGSRESALAIAADSNAIDLPVDPDCIAVVPWTLLVVQGLPKAARQTGLVVVETSISAELLQFSEGNLVHWRFIQNDVQAISEAAADLDADGYRSNGLLWVPGDRKPLFEPPEHWREHEQDVNQCVEASTARIFAGQERPLVFFRGESIQEVRPDRPALLARRLFAIVGLLLLLAIAAGLLLRSSIYRMQATATNTEQAELFQEVFPGQSIPVGMMSRFESEHRALRATKTQEAPKDLSALPVIAAFGRALPQDIRLNSSLIFITKDQLNSFHCEVRSYEKLDALRESFLREGFELPPVSGANVGESVRVTWESVPWTNRETDKSPKQISQSDVIPASGGAE